LSVNYNPTPPAAGASRATKEVELWTDLSDTLPDADARITAVENQTAADVPIADAGGHYTGTNVEAALQEIGAGGGGGGGGALSGLTDVDLDTLPATSSNYVLVEDPDNPGEWLRGVFGSISDDLAAWDSNVTIIDNSAHNGFPGFVIADDGTYVAAVRVGTSHASNDGVIAIAISEDRGATWSALMTVLSGGGYTYTSPSLSKLAGGTLVLSAAREESSAGAKVTDGAVVCLSTDHGATFDSPVVVTHGFDDEALGGGQVVELANGDLLTTVWGKDAADTLWSVTVSKSTDDGATWAHLGTIVDGDTDSRNYNETGLALLPDGTLVAVVRSETGPNHYVVQSTDDGATWGAAAAIGTNGTGNPLLAYDGHRLAFVYRDTPSTGDPLATALSVDGGDTWSLITDDSPSPAGTGEMTYGQMAVDSDGRFALVHAYETVVDGTNSDVFFTTESSSPVTGFVTAADLATGLATKSDTGHTHDGGGGGGGGSSLYLTEGDESGDESTASTTLGDMPGITAVVIPAAEGDELECRFVGLFYASSATNGTFHFNVGGTDQREQFVTLASSANFLYEFIEYVTVTAGMISGGNVTVKPRWKRGTQTLFVTNGTTRTKMQLAVTNRGAAL
jgi:hypothetical protein